MLSTQNPIVLEYYNGNFTNEFKTYRVLVKGWDNTYGGETYIPIYTGRTWFNSAHRTKILLSTILRDYAFKNKVVWNNDLQMYVPYNYNKTTAYPIEYNGEFYCSTFQVEINNSIVKTENVTVRNNDSVFYKAEDPLVAGYTPWITNTPVSGQDNVPTWRSLNLATGRNASNITISQPEVPIHLPNVSSTNVWFELNVALYKRNYQSGMNFGFLQQGGTSGSTYFTSMVGQYANYNLCIPISWFYSRFGYNSNNEYQQLLFTSRSGVSGDTTNIVATFDNCPSPYYLMWNGAFGFMSWRCTGNIVPSENIENETYTDILQVDRNLWNKTRNKWTVNTGVLSKKEHKAVSTLAEAQNIWLYDTEKDKSWYVKLDQSSMTGLKSKTGKSENITLNLTENILHIN